MPSTGAPAVDWRVRASPLSLLSLAWSAPFSFFGTGPPPPSFFLSHLPEILLLSVYISISVSLFLTSGFCRLMTLPPSRRSPSSLSVCVWGIFLCVWWIADMGRTHFECVGLERKRGAPPQLHTNSSLQERLLEDPTLPRRDDPRPLSEEPPSRRRGYKTMYSN